MGSLPRQTDALLPVEAMGFFSYCDAPFRPLQREGVGTEPPSDPLRECLNIVVRRQQALI